MAYLATHELSDLKPSVAARVWSVITGFFESVLEAQGRSAAVTRLQNMTDAQLAAEGVCRDDIVRYVFRDIYHV